MCRGQCTCLSVVRNSPIWGSPHLACNPPADISRAEVNSSTWDESHPGKTPTRLQTCGGETVQRPTPEPNDIRDVHRLIHELCELGADAHAWRVHFQARILSMLHATMASGYVIGLGLDPASIKPQVEFGVET